MGHYPCDDCCTPGVGCNCLCDNCLDTAPCCWKVTIAGMVDDGCTDCDDTLNRDYFLRDSEPAGTATGTSGTDTANDCYWESESICTLCDPERISLEIIFDDPNYKMRVTLGAHVWEKDFGATKPDCCILSNQSLTHITNSGDCDSSSATCIVSTNREPADCPQQCVHCCTTSSCNSDAISQKLQITIAGIQDGTEESPCEDTCKNTSVLNGTFVATFFPGCAALHSCFWGTGFVVLDDPCNPERSRTYNGGGWIVEKQAFPSNFLKVFFTADYDTADESCFCFPRFDKTLTGKLDCDNINESGFTAQNGDTDGEKACQVSAAATCTVQSI